MPGRIHGHRVLGWRQLTNKELADKVLLDAGATDRELALAERLVEEIESSLDLRAKLRGLRQRLARKAEEHDEVTRGHSGHDHSNAG